MLFFLVGLKEQVENKREKIEFGFGLSMKNNGNCIDWKVRCSYCKNPFFSSSQNDFRCRGPEWLPRADLDSFSENCFAIETLIMVIFSRTPIIALLLKCLRKWMALWPSTRHLAKVNFFLKSFVRRNILTFLLQNICDYAHIAQCRGSRMIVSDGSGSYFSVGFGSGSGSCSGFYINLF